MQAVAACVQVAEKFEPIPANVAVYNELYDVYQQVYAQTKALNDQLKSFR